MSMRRFIPRRRRKAHSDSSAIYDERIYDERQNIFAVPYNYVTGLMHILEKKVLGWHAEADWIYTFLGGCRNDSRAFC